MRCFTGRICFAGPLVLRRLVIPCIRYTNAWYGWRAQFASQRALYCASGRLAGGDGKSGFSWMCWFELISPGITVMPAASITSAPGGTATVSIGPISTIRSPRMTTVWSCRGGAPVASTSRPPTIAIGLSGRYGGACGPHACASTASHATSVAARSRARVTTGTVCLVISASTVRKGLTPCRSDRARRARRR